MKKEIQKQNWNKKNGKTVNKKIPTTVEKKCKQNTQTTTMK